LASAQGLLVGVGSDVFAIPINAVERILRIQPSEVASVRGKATLRIDGRLIPIVSIAEVLQTSHRGLQPDDAGMFSVVVVGAVEKRVAFVVDELIEEQDIVSKQLGKPLVRVRNVAGATILGDGRVVVLLNPSDLVLSAFGESIKAVVVEEMQDHATILVADDTMTTRTLQKQLLEMAGYRVLTAKDGEEAYQMLQTEAVQVLVSDVQMPRLDGFDLTARIRGNTKLKNLPIILVTSLGSEADKARGVEVGADAYIVKKEYEKGKILEVIRQLL
jgi:two-component system, chemotaxis family, sensor kinase CheA